MSIPSALILLLLQERIAEILANLGNALMKNGSATMTTKMKSVRRISELALTKFHMQSLAAIATSAMTANTATSKGGLHPRMDLRTGPIVPLIQPGSQWRMSTTATSRRVRPSLPR